MTTLQANFDAGRARIRSQNEDARRGEFLRALDDSGENLNDFETAFLGDFLKERGGKTSDADFRWFSIGRRQVVDNMIHRYGFRTLRAPAGATQKLPEAAPGHCGYLVRDPDSNRRVCCDRPATTQSPRGLELCAEHTVIRVEELAQLRNAKMRLRS